MRERASRSAVVPTHLEPTRLESVRWLRGLVAALTLLASFASGSAAAQADFFVRLQAIVVCDDDGSNCATPIDYKQFETDKVWAQAGVEFRFLSEVRQLNSTQHNFQSNGDEMDDLAADVDNMANTDPGVVNVWFLAGFNSGTNARTRPFSLAIAMHAPKLDPAFNPSFPEGRIDVLAHELGHIFQMDHNTFGAGGSENLMTAGGSRTLPTNSGDLFPDGLQTDQLNASQIAQTLLFGNLLIPVSQGILRVQQIRVCDDDGSNCASPTDIKTSETIKVWEQAGITVRYPFAPRQLNSTAHNNLENAAAMSALVSDPNNQAHENASVVNVWLVSQTPAGAPGLTSGTGVALSALALSPATNPSFPEGRIDVLAHELGHVLGLDHVSLGAGDPLNLMTPAGARTLPTTRDDLFPHGLLTDQLSASQIALAQSNLALLTTPTAVPALSPPSSIILCLLLAAAGAMGVNRARRQSLSPAAPTGIASQG